jgi:hypothetical protein
MFLSGVIYPIMFCVVLPIVIRLNVVASLDKSAFPSALSSYIYSPLNQTLSWIVNNLAFSYN